MSQKPLEPSKTETILKRVEHGMDVYDSRGERFGTVTDLFFGASSDEMRKHGAGAATAPNPSPHTDSLVEDIAEALAINTDIPEEMRQRMLNEGYVLVHGNGLFAADYYVLTEQIDHVSGLKLYLNAEQGDLIER